MSHDSCNHADIETPLKEAVITLDAQDLYTIQHGRVRVAHFHGSNLKGGMLTVFLTYYEHVLDKDSKEIKIAQFVGDVAGVALSRKQTKMLFAGHKIYSEFAIGNATIKVLIQYGVKQ